MKKPISFLFLIAMIVGVLSCNANATDNISPDEYYRLLESLETAFIENKIQEIPIVLTHMDNLQSIEVPNYETYFFDAVIELERGNILKGKDKLDIFETMLLVDSGHIRCANLEDNKALTIVRSKMCAEYFHSYYQEPSALTQKKILKYWHLIHITKKRYELN